MSQGGFKILLVAKHSKNKKFEKLLKEIFPAEIPIEMIDNILVDFKNGTQGRLDHTELKDPLPTAPNKKWSALIQAFSNVEKITIVVDVNTVEKVVGDSVSDILDRHFD